jgi:hypothetical protein
LIESPSPGDDAQSVGLTNSTAIWKNESWMFAEKARRLFRCDGLPVFLKPSCTSKLLLKRQMGCIKSEANGIPAILYVWRHTVAVSALSSSVNRALL